ncbi:MAG: hypothetical protein U1E61_02675 [Bradyrhizobium sp.]
MTMNTGKPNMIAPAMSDVMWKIVVPSGTPLWLMLQTGLGQAHWRSDDTRAPTVLSCRRVCELTQRPAIPTRDASASHWSATMRGNDTAAQSHSRLEAGTNNIKMCVTAISQSSRVSAADGSIQSPKMVLLQHAALKLDACKAGHGDNRAIQLAKKSRVRKTSPEVHRPMWRTFRSGTAVNQSYLRSTRRDRGSPHDADEETNIWDALFGMVSRRDALHSRRWAERRWRRHLA